MKILITIVNYNTAELLSHLLYSLYRVIGHRPLRNCDILVIDNNSTDMSAPIIRAMQRNKLIRSIINKEQLYHGRGLNQGLDIAIKENYDIFWALDSDMVILRTRILRDAINSFENRKLDMMAQDNDIDELHVSCMMLRVDTVRRLNGRFVHGGNPSRCMERQWRNSDAVLKSFPFRSSYYALHAGCGTRKVVKDMGDSSNNWYGDIADCSPWYHGDPLAPGIHNDFKQIFKAEVPEIKPRLLVRACLNKNRISLKLPRESPGIDTSVLSPTARGRRARRTLKAMARRKLKEEANAQKLNAGDG